MHSDSKYQSVSEQMLSRLERRQVWRRLVTFVYVTGLIAYLSWRFTIINEDSLALSIAFYIAEVIGFILGLTTILTSWKYRHRKSIPAPEGLSVDVLVPVYQEPIEIIRRTLVAAKGIEYSHKTFVLDDGHRPEIKAIADELGIHYLSRSENKDAKAGNLNFGLKHSSAEYFMVLDADHIAMPYALHKMLGFFEDPNVALVQTPQNYYNIDAFQYMNDDDDRALWHDQSFFYNIAQSCRDFGNGASCVGTGVVYRRTAIDGIGGIPTVTVTEDIHTSLKLHKVGHEVVYLNESVAYGVAASDLDEYHKTRYRWASGNLHCLSHENILFCKGLTLKQRISYLSLGLIYLEGWQQLLLFIIPLFSLVFGLAPFDISIFNIAVVLLFPWFTYLLLQEIGCGFTRFWANEIFSMARWPIHIAASMGLLGWRTRWISSRKNIKGKVNWRLMAPQMAVILFSLFALFIAFYRLSQDFQTGPIFALLTGPIFVLLTGPFSKHSTENLPVDIFEPMSDGYTVDLVLIAGVWALYSIVRGIAFIRKAKRDAKNSHSDYRFRLSMVCQFSATQTFAEIDRISESWMSVYCNQKLKVGLEHPIQIYGPSGIIPALLKVNKSNVLDNKLYKVSGDIVFTEQQAKDRLSLDIYSIDWHREIIQRNGYFPTVSEQLIGLFIRKKSIGQSYYSVLFDRHSHGVVVDNSKLVTHKKIEAGQRFRALKIEQNQVSIFYLTVDKEINSIKGALPRINNQKFYLYQVIEEEDKITRIEGNDLKQQYIETFV